MKRACIALTLSSLVSACVTETRYVAPAGSPSEELRARFNERGARVSEDYLRKYDRYKLLAAQPTPESWRVGAVWRFEVAPKSKKTPTSGFVFQVTDAPAQTCSSGDWRRLEVLESSGETIHEPAYSVEGRNLHILLSTGLCDADDEVTGELSVEGFTGEREFSHLLGSEKHGAVHGRPMRD